MPAAMCRDRRLERRGIASARRPMSGCPQPNGAPRRRAHSGRIAPISVAWAAEPYRSAAWAYVPAGYRCQARGGVSRSAPGRWALAFPFRVFSPRRFYLLNAQRREIHTPRAIMPGEITYSRQYGQVSFSPQLFRLPGTRPVYSIRPRSAPAPCCATVARPYGPRRSNARFSTMNTGI